MTQACMGGWCRLRHHCPHYHAENRSDPSERLCYPGEDGNSAVIAVRVTRGWDWDQRRLEHPDAMTQEAA